ncbi:DNA polymerase IV [Halovenus halobia]|uniref:DNA polymerase IV n=1 Tax=Halovenus halobia TaxID=3396622 RepID=UPI003F5574D7
MERGRLPGVSAPEQIICHADMDCFYAACERLREPALQGEPLVVGMGYEPGTTNGAVATASYEARDYGVESAQAISEALELLPRKIDVARNGGDVDAAGFYRPVDMEYYESIAEDAQMILDEEATTVRNVSIDEAYLDITDRIDWDDAGQFGRQLKDRIESEVGVTASLGIAPTMSAAKVASDHDKPDGLVVVEPGDVQSFLAGLPVEDVHGVGPVTADQMSELGIETAGDLAGADPAKLDSEFGERGRRVRRYARGEDEREVQPTGRPKSFSRESAFHEPTADAETQYDRVDQLATAVAERTARRDVLYQTIGIKAVLPPFDVRTRAQSLSGPVADEQLLREVAAELFEEFAGERIRKVGVRVSNLSFSANDQPTLSAFGTDETEEETQRSLTDFD